MALAARLFKHLKRQGLRRFAGNWKRPGKAVGKICARRARDLSVF